MSSRRLSGLVFCGWIALGASALPAAAMAPAAAEAPPPIRLLAPAADAGLVAGDEAEIAWEPLASFANLGRVEEWEAFLSLDGGATYPFRLTPHLDHDLRRFRWRVPAVPSADARLLFRFGDERREVPVYVPQRFVIEAPAAPAWLPDTTIDIGRRSPRVVGESALPGQRGVVAWVEGSRRGTGLRHVVGSGVAEIAPAQALPDSPRGADVADSQRTPRAAAAVARTATSQWSLAIPSADAPALAPPRPCADLLLLTQRRNE